MQAIMHGAEMAPKKDRFALGSNTPITIGLALMLLGAIVGFVFKAGSLSKEIDGLSYRIIGIETREQQNSKNNIDLITKLTRIETLLEYATASIARLEKEKPIRP